MFRSLQLFLTVALLSVVTLPSVAQNAAFLVGGNFDEAFHPRFPR